MFRVSLRVVRDLERMQRRRAIRPLMRMPQKPRDCILNDRSFLRPHFLREQGDGVVATGIFVLIPPFELREWTDKNADKKGGVEKGWHSGHFFFFFPFTPIPGCPSHQTERAKGADWSQVSTPERASVRSILFMFRDWGLGGFLLLPEDHSMQSSHNFFLCCLMSVFFKLIDEFI